MARVADESKKHGITLEEAVFRTRDIDEAPDPYPYAVVLVASYMGAAGGLAIVLQGSWWDVLVSTIGGGLCLAVQTIFGRYMPSQFRTWSLVACAFVPAVLATAVKIKQPGISTVLSTLSAVAIPLPGYTVSLGVAELASNKITRGAAHLIQGVITLLWLIAGGDVWRTFRLGDC